MELSCPSVGAGNLMGLFADMKAIVIGMKAAMEVPFDSSLPLLSRSMGDKSLLVVLLSHRSVDILMLNADTLYRLSHVYKVNIRKLPYFFCRQNKLSHLLRRVLEPD